METIFVQDNFVVIFFEEPCFTDHEKKMQKYDVLEQQKIEPYISHNANSCFNVITDVH